MVMKLGLLSVALALCAVNVYAIPVNFEEEGFAPIKRGDDGIEIAKDVLGAVGKGTGNFAPIKRGDDGLGIAESVIDALKDKDESGGLDTAGDIVGNVNDRVNDKRAYKRGGL